MSSIVHCRYCRKELYDHAGCYERAEKFEEMKQWKAKYEEVKGMLIELIKPRYKESQLFRDNLQVHIKKWWFEQQKEKKDE